MSVRFELDMEEIARCRTYESIVKRIDVLGVSLKYVRNAIASRWDGPSHSLLPLELSEGSFALLSLQQRPLRCSARANL